MRSLNAEREEDVAALGRHVVRLAAAVRASIAELE